MADETPALLAPEESARLTDFARACKAAARAVVLYPNGHPAIATTLGRIAHVTSSANLAGPLRISVTADALRLDGRALPRPDPAIAELAALLHVHLIGELTVRPGGDVEAWRTFLLLLGRPPDAVRAEGGITRVWTTMAGRHVELREIDYAEVLRERTGVAATAWEAVIASCLQGGGLDLNEETIREFVELAGDSTKLTDLIGALDARAVESGAGVGVRTAALMALLQGIVDAVKQSDPERLEPVLQNIAAAAGRLSPDMLASMLSRETGGAAGTGETGAGLGLAGAVASRMSDGTIAQFVARNAVAENTSIERVAQVFHTLVRDTDQRERLLTLAHDEAASSPLGATEGFEEVWENVAQKMMTSYSDKPFVSDDYARELTSARTKATEVEQLSDDPPERISAWLGTVATTELRKLDLTLVLDLLRIEQDTKRWSTLMRPAVALLEDLLLVGDFDAAETLTAALVQETQSQGGLERRQTAMVAIDVLVSGPMMRHIVTHLPTIDEAQFERVKAMCLVLGEVLIRPLAEALTAEERARPRERLTAILIGFGAIGRREVERLKNSPNPAVRRTAVYLLREFGGSDALPQLTELLDDREPRVQREAVRAILNIGTERAFKVVQEALTSGTQQSREAIMQSLLVVHDERATPLFSFILRNVDHRGELQSIYLHAVEALGTLKDPAGIEPLKETLYRGEWWAPRRTAKLRNAAAAALARIATAEAAEVLDEAIASGPRGVRAAARAHAVDRPRDRARLR